MKRFLLLAGLLTGVPSIAAEPRATFTRDVAPILYAHCAPCHIPDGALLFNLITYADARHRARLMARVTRSRYMPLWKPDSHEFAGDRRLTEAQIATLERWAAGGAVEGDAADLPPPPRLTSGWQSGPPDLLGPPPRHL